MLGRLASALMALCAGAALGHDGKHGSAHSDDTPAPGQRWDFTLPTLDGSRFVQASALRGPVLVNFWGRDCAPCITELPRLEAFAKANPAWTVLLVSTDAPNVAAEFVQRRGLTLTVLRPGANVGALMRSAGNRSGGLPFTLALQTDAPGSRICERHLGEVSSEHLAQFAERCR